MDMKVMRLKCLLIATVHSILLMIFSMGILHAYQESPLPVSEQVSPAEEPYDNGWQFYFDNDAFLGSDKDRNYTSGIALTLNGRRAAEYWFSADGLLGQLDRLTGYQQLRLDSDGVSRHSIEFGLTIFTPDNIKSENPLPNDHPYANLLFINNSSTTAYPVQGRLYNSTLLIGLLGTGVGEQVQKRIHQLVGSDEPRGWNNQISDGGELTAKYAMSMEQVLAIKQGDLAYDIRGGLSGSLGVTTDISASAAFARDLWAFHAQCS